MTNWPLEVLYILNGDLRRLAVQVKKLSETDHLRVVLTDHLIFFIIFFVQADKQMEKRGEKPVRLEECARTINKAFTICITDRAQLRISKKWGTYNIIGILFRTYFKVKKHSIADEVD